MKKAQLESPSRKHGDSGSVPLAHTSWLRPFVDFFEEQGIDPEPHMKTVGVEPGLIFSGDDWITKHQLYRFLDEVAVAERIPELGFVVGERLTYETLGAIGEAIAKAETVGGALREFCRLIPRHVEGNKVWMEGDCGGDVWLLNRTENPGSEIADHAGLMSMINLVRLGLGSDWYPQKMRLQVAPTDAHERVRHLTDRELEFDCPATGFAFPTTALTRDLTITPPDNLSTALLVETEPVADKLQRLLRGIVGIGGIVPTIDMMAELAGISARTLHRRLRQGGVTYQLLLDRARHERAIELLQHSDSSVKELAFELGYSGANNFIRAFRRMAGTTPGQYREARSASPQIL